jgi:hypothetical protein
MDAVTVAGMAGGGEHRAPRRSRRHAWAALVYVSVLLLVAYRGEARRRMWMDADSFAMLMPFVFWSVSIVGWGVRMGRLRVDAAGVRWGFSWLGFRMVPDRVSVVRIYRDAVAVYSTGFGRRAGEGRSATPWTLLARDWERWDEVVRSFERMGVPVEHHDRKAPLFARMQGYGRALDLILVLNSVGATLVVLGA